MTGPARIVHLTRSMTAGSVDAEPLCGASALNTTIHLARLYDLAYLRLAEICPACAIAAGLA